MVGELDGSGGHVRKSRCISYQYSQMRNHPCCRSEVVEYSQTRIPGRDQEVELRNFGSRLDLIWKNLPD